MGVWDTRSGALGRLKYYLERAEDYQKDITGHVSFMNADAGAGQWQQAFSHAADAFNEIIFSLNYLIARKSSDYRDFSTTFFLETYTIAEAPEYELTWSKIVAAWADADTLGRLWTTLAIDYMRKEVWNEPVTTFEMAKGAASK